MPHLRGYLDAHDRAIVGLRLGNGNYLSAPVDTGFNRLLLFSSTHASELSLGFPRYYDSYAGPGGELVEAGPVDLSFYWLEELRHGTAMVAAPPRRGSLFRRTSLEEQEPLALIGTKLLRGCHLSISFRSGVRFPVKIRKLNR